MGLDVEEFGRAQVKRWFLHRDRAVDETVEGQQVREVSAAFDDQPPPRDVGQSLKDRYTVLFGTPAKAYRAVRPARAGEALQIL